MLQSLQDGTTPSAFSAFTLSLASSFCSDTCLNTLKFTFNTIIPKPFSQEYLVLSHPLLGVSYFFPINFDLSYTFELFSPCSFCCFCPTSCTTISLFQLLSISPVFHHPVPTSGTWENCFPKLTSLHPLVFLLFFLTVTSRLLHFTVSKLCFAHGPVKSHQFFPSKT